MAWSQTHKLQMCMWSTCQFDRTKFGWTRLITSLKKTWDYMQWEFMSFLRIKTLTQTRRQLTSNLMFCSSSKVGTKITSPDSLFRIESWRNRPCKYNYLMISTLWLGHTPLSDIIKEINFFNWFLSSVLLPPIWQS